MDAKRSGFSAVKEDFYRETLNLKYQEEQIQTLLDKEILAVKKSSKTGQELPLFYQSCRVMKELLNL